MIVSAVLGAVLALLYVRLALNVVKGRRQHRVSVGHGDNPDLHRAIRAQGNLAEYAPIILILLMCLEYNGAPIWLTAIIGIVAGAGRLLHARGMTLPETDRSVSKSRVWGMYLTLWPIIGLAVLNVLWLFVIK